MALELDVQIMRAVMAELDNPPRPREEVGAGMFVETLSGPLSDSRLVRMLETPGGAGGTVSRHHAEICFWLLTGPHGAEVCKLAAR